MIFEASKNGLWSIRLHWAGSKNSKNTGSKNNPQKSDFKCYFKYIFIKYNNNTPLKNSN